MKNNYQRLVALSCLLLTCTNSISQEKNTFTITPERSKEAIKNVRMLGIFPASYKEIEYRGYVTGEVPTEEYQRVQKTLEHYKPDYDDYVNQQKSNSDKRKTIGQIVNNIDKFLDSDEKSSVKEQYLIEAQKLADENEIQLSTTKETSLLKRISNNIESKYGNSNPNERTLRLRNGDKNASKGDVKLYRELIQSIKFDEPQKTHNYRQYVELLDNSTNIKKTETGKVLSDKTTKKSAFVIEEKSIITDQLSGTFTEMPTQYRVALSDIEGYFVKNELVSDMQGYNNTGKLSEPYPLIKKEGTEEYYYIISDNYLSLLRGSQEKNELINIVHKLGYKEYKSKDMYDDNLYIKSKTCEIKLDRQMYQELKANPNYIAKLDADQAQILALTKQAVTHSQTLDKYLSQYRIQRNKMPTASLNAWRNATANAQKLNNQIYKLTEKYENNYSFRLLNKSNTLDVFLDNLLASKGVLGM